MNYLQRRLHMDYDSIWLSFLEKIEQNLTPINYTTWFADTKLINLDDHAATILVPIHVHKKHLKESYYDLIVSVFSEVTGSNFTFEFVTEDDLKKQTNEESEIGVPSVKSFQSNLNPSYTFENFIIGESNKFAGTTALAVAEKPGYMYNPLFIYSKSGLGKTHLLHAIGNYIVQNLNQKVLYVTSEQFVNDFIELYRKNKKENNIEATEQFKRKYRDVDVLMIDDIQYLEIAAKTQQEFFNTFNDLHTKNKQIIITSDRSPDDLKQLEERLRTRFTWGLMVDIKPPNFDLRLQIINKKIDSHDLASPFPDEAKEFIASNCTSDIRKLEGAITRVIAFATMMNKSKITPELAIDALKDYFGNCVTGKNKIEQVLHVVAQHYNISIDDMKSKKRISEIAVPRQIAMFICRTIYNEALTKIGLAFGGKNHTTVMHSVEKIKNKSEEDSAFNLEIKKIIEKIEKVS